jgi:alkylation response protein AidB-like acyl-CoA dehydrogenase
MDFCLPEELEDLREAAARFAEKEIAPHARDWDRDERFADDIVAKLGEQGFMGILAPEAYEGAGGNLLSFCVVLEEIARRDGGLALAVEAHNGLCIQHILIAGNEAQKKRWLPDLASGRVMGSWCLSEPESGTDAIAMKTRAERDGEDWVISGTKQFITNGDRAGVFVVTAVTGREGDRNQIGAFAIERGAKGLSFGKPEEKLGMRSSGTVTVALDGVRVEADRLLGGAETGFGDVKKVLEKGRVAISAISIGLARGALEDSLRYAHSRRAFGRPIIEFQQIQAKIADMATRIEAARLLMHRAATTIESGATAQRESAMSKLFASEMATSVCMDAIQILGGYGYLREYDVERYMRDAKLCEIGEGTSEILRVLIAREAGRAMGLEGGVE